MVLRGQRIDVPCNYYVDNNNEAGGYIRQDRLAELNAAVTGGTMALRAILA